MAFVVLNIINGIFLIGQAISMDSRIKTSQNHSLVTMTLFSVVISFLYSACIMLGFFVNEQMTKVLGVVILFMSAMFSVRFALFCFTYPNKPIKFYHRVLQIALILFAAFVLIRHISAIHVTAEEGFRIISDEVGIGDINWADLFKTVYIIGVPAFALLTLLLRIESIKSQIHRQQILLITIDVVLAVAIISLLEFTRVRFLPMFNTLLPIVYSIFLYVLDKSVNMTVLFDFSIVLRTINKIIFNYVIPAVIVGLILAFSFPLRRHNMLLFLVVNGVSIFGIMAGSYYVNKYFRKRSKHYERNYASVLEEELAGLNYNVGAGEIARQLSVILQNNLDISSVDVLIEQDENEISTIYSTQDRVTNVRLDNPLFDVVLNADHPIVFKSHIETHHVLASGKNELNRLMDSTYSEALIVLKEGRKIFGVILLGPKKLGNAFTDYDYETFQNLYSYFFVVGYYLKNIVNESVIGTVNRELQFSGQIIESIQENIDVIDIPKVDVGYIQKSAHTLGGEYIDFIRLTDERYISVLGDLSGKGINASMSMVIVKSIIRTYLAETKDFKVLVQKVNEFIRYNLPRGTFFAGIFMLLDFSDNTVYYINCGVPALFMYNQQYNNVIEIQGEGRVLGFVPSIDKLLRVKKVKLNPGDIILACTDGLIDSQSLRGEQFGKGRIQQTILENLNYPASKISQFLFTALQEFTSKELEDDVTIVTMKCLAK